MSAMTNQLMPSLRTKSLVLIFLLAVTLLYIPVLLKLLLLRRIVMLTQTTLKSMLLSGRTSIRLVFAFFMCHPMLVVLPALVLHLTRRIHTPNIFIVKSGRLRKILDKFSLDLIFSRDLGLMPLPAFTAIDDPYMCSRTTYW